MSDEYQPTDLRSVLCWCDHFPAIKPHKQVPGNPCPAQPLQRDADWLTDIQQTAPYGSLEGEAPPVDPYRYRGAVEALQHAAEQAVLYGAISDPERHALLDALRDLRQVMPS